VGDLAVGSLASYAAVFTGPITSTSVDKGAVAKIIGDGPPYPDGFGEFLQGIDDQDGDGYDELIVSATAFPDGEGAGRSYIFLGPVSGNDSAEEMASATITGQVTGDHLGFSPTSGDVDGDGVADVLVGAPYLDASRGAAFVFYGPVTTGDLGPLEADATWSGMGADEAVGFELTANGDIDGDGVNDVAIGAPLQDSASGAVWIAYGPVAGDHAIDEADVKVSGAEEAASLTYTANGGDLDGDGRDDLVVAANYFGGGVGNVWLFDADSIPAGGTLDVATADATITADESGDIFGWILNTEGDLDADGFDDLIVGSYYAASFRGSAWGYYGPVSGALDATPDASFRILGDEKSSGVGASAVLVPDVTGDALDDLAVGAILVAPNAALHVFEGRSRL
jgi:hypothetical protein